MNILNPFLNIYHLNPFGFILISADKRTTPFLGYSFDNNFTLLNLPENLSYLMDSYKLEVLNNMGNTSRNINNTNMNWEYYLSD